jgi:hypothetical protein
VRFSDHVGGESLKTAAAVFRLSRQSAAKWERRCRVEGASGLRDRSSRPRRLRTATSKSVRKHDALEAPVLAQHVGQEPMVSACGHVVQVHVRAHKATCSCLSRCMKGLQVNISAAALLEHTTSHSHVRHPPHHTLQNASRIPTHWGRSLSLQIQRPEPASGKPRCIHFSHYCLHWAPTGAYWRCREV